MDKNKTKEKKKHTAIVITGVVLFVALALAVFLNMDKIYSSEKSVSGYPVTFTGNDVIEAQPMKGGISVLTGKSLHFLNKRGEEKFQVSYTLAEPALSAKGKYGVIFDRRSYSYIFFDSTGYERQGKTQDSAYIYLAEVSKKGDLVIVTKSSSSACNLYLYDKNGNEIFAWACGDEYIVDVDIDPSSKEILCGAIGAYNGEICTKAYLLDPDKEEPIVAEYSLLSASCVNVQLHSGRAIITCGDRIAAYNTNKADDNGLIAEFSSPSLRFAKDDEGNTAIITDAASKENGEYCLTMYDSKGAVVYTAFFDYDVRDMHCDNGTVYLLDDYTVRRFTIDGSEKDSLSLSRKGLGITVYDGGVYSYALGSVERAFVS